MTIRTFTGKLRIVEALGAWVPDGNLLLLEQRIKRHAITPNGEKYATYLVLHLSIWACMFLMS